MRDPLEGRRTVETVLGPLKVVPECRAQAVCVNGSKCWEAGRCLRSPQDEEAKADINEFRDGLTRALNRHGVPAMPSWDAAIDWLAEHGGSHDDEIERLRAELEAMTTAAAMYREQSDSLRADVRSSGSAAQNQEAARVVCSWCEGTGWVCDGCGRPEKLCMASACGAAALSMSGCPKCYRGGCGGSGYVEVRSSGSAAQNQEGPPPIEEDAGYWRKMYEELHSITAGDPTSIYHEHEQLRRRIVELEAARSPQDENYEAGIYAAGRALAVTGGDEELYDRGDPIAMEWRDEARAVVDAYLSRCSQGIEAQRWRLAAGRGHQRLDRAMLRADAAEAELARLKASPSSERDTEKLVEALREIAKYDSATAAGQDLVQYLVGIAREALAEFSAPPAGTPDDKEQP